MNNIKIIAVLLLILGVSGCEKYLNAVPDSELTIPKTVADFQQMLENEKMFTGAPALGEFGTDNIVITDDILAAQHITFQNGYIYAKDVFAGARNSDWNNAYEKIYYANIVLEGIEKLDNDNNSNTNINQLKGWALFCRANAFYDLEEVFGQPYHPLTANTDLGIPLKLSSNLTEGIRRSTVAETYQQIINDLEEAILLLPVEVSRSNRSKPSKSAAYGLLARIYLITQNYSQALINAENSLSQYRTLIDYNTLSTTARLPFNPLIDEIVYHSLQLIYLPSNCQIDKDLYDSYKDNDLRKVLFFNISTPNNVPLFKGSYGGGNGPYNGLATDEIYLTRAECYARLGDDQKALDDINTLLLKRFKTGFFVPYTKANTADVLSLVLTERRKECVLRNLRWPDLRRLNQDARYAKTITHFSKGVTYHLAPGDPKYALPIPDDEIRSSGLTQNIR